MQPGMEMEMGGGVYTDLCLTSLLVAIMAASKKFAGGTYASLGMLTLTSLLLGSLVALPEPVVSMLQ